MKNLDGKALTMDIPMGGPVYDYIVKEIKDLALMFRVAAEHKCVMETWW